MVERIEKSLLKLDFASLTRRTFTPSPAAWEDQVLYFLLLDRLSDPTFRTSRPRFLRISCRLIPGMTEWAAPL